MVLLAVVLLLAGGLYLNSLSGGFILDDYDVIVNQPKIRDLSGAFWFFSNVDIVDKESLPEETVWRNPYYRPFFFLTFVLDYQLHGKDPRGYHATNILLHMAVTALLFFSARRLSGSDLTAACASLFFAVHPAHAEAVVWITARNHLLGGLFMLAGFEAYRAYAENRGRVFLGISCLALALALLSTEMAVMGVALIAVYGMTAGKKSFRPAHLLPYLAVLACYFIARVLVMGSAITQVKTMTLGERLMTVPYILARYLKDVFVPVDIPAAYTLTPVTGMSDPRFLGPLVLVAALLALLFTKTMKKSALASYGLFWFFVSIFPVLNIVQEVQPFPMAARYLYIPSIGISLSVAALAASLARFHRLMPAAVTAAVVIALSMFTRTTAGFYLDDARIKALILPKDAQHQVMLAGVCLAKGDLPQALKISREILQRDAGLTEAYLLLGDTYRKMGRDDQAADAFVMAIRNGRKLPPKEHAYHQLGVIYGQQGRYRESAEMLELAVSVRPSVEAYQNLGLSYSALGMEKEAARSYELASRLRFEAQ